MMDELVEFFMTCDPPLRASGVAYVMAQVKKPLGDTEILYDPTVPWFKVVTRPSKKDEIEREIGILLQHVTEKGTRPVAKPEKLCSGTVADIQTTDDHVMPWSAHTKEPLDGFKPFRFPTTMNCTFIDTWPASDLDWDLDELIRAAEFFNSSKYPASIDSLGFVLRCTVSHDICGSTLYVGTNDQETLQHALSALDSLALFAAQFSSTTRHFIYTTRCNEKFCYKWLSHVGLLNGTYPEKPMDNSKLASAVTIRSISENEQGRWITGRPQLPVKATIATETLTSKFWIYPYLKKQAQKWFFQEEQSRPSPRGCAYNIGSNELPGLNRAFQADQKQQPLEAVSLLDDDPPAISRSPSKSNISKKSVPHHTRPHIIKLVDTYFQPLWRILPRYPGYISVRLCFGRFYLTDLSSAQVDVGSGPRWEIQQLLQGLQHIQPNNIGFSPILSLLQTDIAKFIQSLSSLPSPWTVVDDEMTYRVHCTLHNKELNIDINAKSFDFSCQGPVSELRGAFLHCVHNTWDMKLTVSHANNLNSSPIHKAVGQAITNSLHISTTKQGPCFELMADESVGSITAVEIRHVTRYSSIKVPGSILSIVRCQKLAPTEEKYKRRKWLISQQPQGKATCEAFISSTKLRFEGNAELPLGQCSSTSWDTSSTMDICDDLLGPALGLVSQLDEVGLSNDNGLGGESRLRFNDSVAEAAARNGKGRETFW